MSACGTASRYKAGCRCNECRRAHAVDHKRWLMGQTGSLVNAVGTKRRIQALAALGWTYGEIAEACGATTRGWTNEVLRQERVHSDTANSVSAAFERMSMTIPDGAYRGRGRNVAANKGWPPPLAWNNIDDANEVPFGWQYAGEDRAETLADLDGLNLGVSEACRRLSMTRDGLEKWCERHDQRDLFRRLLRREQPTYWANQHTEHGVAS